MSDIGDRLRAQAARDLADADRLQGTRESLAAEEATLRARADQALADALAVDLALDKPTPPVPVPPPPPPPAPTPGPAPFGPLTVTTNGYNLADASRPPVITDTIDLSRALPPIPWSVFRDGQQTIAHPMQGREPDYWRRLTVYGLPNEYSMTAAAVVDGQLQMLYPASVNDADPAALIVPHTRAFPVRSGQRGEAITTPYWIVRGHTRRLDDGSINTDPHMPAWIGLDMVGRLYYLMRDGSVQIVATIPLESYANDFSYWPEQRRVMFVTDTGVGKVLKVRRDGATFAVEGSVSVPGRATSCRMVGPWLYVANERAVIEVDPATMQVRREVCALSRVFWLDYLSDGRLVAMTRHSAIHVIDPQTGEIGPDLNGKDSVNGADYRNAAEVGWVMCEVDRAGTCGLVDTILACASHNLAINGPWRITPQGRIDRIPGIAGAGRALAGRSTTTVEGFHYGWVVALHPDDGMMLIHGGAQILPIIYAAVSNADTSWPADDNYDHSLAARGYSVIRQGASSADRAQQMPLAASMNAGGGGFVGCTVDHLAEMPFDDALAFVRRGLLSTTPRQIDDADALPVLYWIARGSQRYVREGRVLMEALKAWAGR